MAQILRVVKASGVQYGGHRHGYLAEFECDDEMAAKLVDKVKWCELVRSANSHLLHANEPLAPIQVAAEAQTMLAAERVNKAERQAKSIMGSRKKAADAVKEAAPVTPAGRSKTVRELVRETETNRDNQMRKVHDRLKQAAAGPSKGRKGVASLGKMNLSPAELDGPSPSDAELTRIAAENVKKAEAEAKRQVEARRAKPATDKKGAGEIASLSGKIQG